LVSRPSRLRIRSDVLQRKAEEQALLGFDASQLIPPTQRTPRLLGCALDKICSSKAISTYEERVCAL
jgi:hypothetical protein